MDSILKYDKVILIKEFGKMKFVGETYEVANITETSFVLRDVKSKIAVGVIDIKDFKEYFEKVKDVKGWTPWTEIADEYGRKIFYRTNHKKVQVRYLKNIRAEASCNTMDDFNLYFGIHLAYARCKEKYLNMRKQNCEEVLKEINSDKYNCEEALKEINSDIKQNNKFMKNMIDSLDKKQENN